MDTTATTTPTMKFGTKHTISAFKQANNASKLDIVKNPHTGKVFFTCGSASGKVSNKGYQPNPVITECTDEDNNTFFMLHSEADTNVVDSL